ncbi:zinc-ribbon domain-containing protein [Myxococcus sp. CA051A]|nr:zinc-ribbon domain-containing protein [Myxococcus sp. CA051A]
MQIACPQCSMQYVLDPRLLPPGGASVQCTRCGHVFMASPQAEAPRPPPVDPAGPRTPSGSWASASSPAASSMLRTQIFGSGQNQGASGAVPPVDVGTAAHGAVPNTTQTFGAVPPVRAGAGSQGAVPNTTQTFGAAPPVRAGAGSQGAVPNTTQTFGAVPPVSAGPPGAVPNTTQTFGAVPPVSAGPYGAVPNTTQTFGAVPPVRTDSGPHGTVPNATQTFGAVPPVRSDSGPHGTVPNATHTFGAVPPVRSDSGPHGAVPNTTQTFGAVPPVSSGPHGAVPNTTQTFGAVSPVSSGTHGVVPNTTQTFGAVPPVSLGQHGAVPNTTQTFGAVPPVSAGPHGAVPNTTQTFGAVPPVSSGPHGAVPNTTQTFGAVPPVRADAGPHGSVPNTTQTFGAVPGPAHASSGDPSGQGSSAGGVRQSTQVFGLAAQGSTVPPSIAPVSGGSTEAPASLGRTLTFGAMAAQSTPTAPGEAPSLAGEAQTRAYGDAPGGTQSYGAIGSESSPTGLLSAPVERKTTLYGAALGPGAPSGSVRLPPEDMSGVGTFGAGASLGASEPRTPSSRRVPVSLPPELLAAGRDDSEFPGMAPSSRSSRLWLGLLVAAGVLLAGVLAYPAWRDRNANMPADAVADKDRAAALLRRDDATSRDQAIKTLRGLTTVHPKYTEARAELVGALSLRLGELQAQAERLRMRSEYLQREIEILTRTRESVDWESRVNVLRESTAEVVQLSGPLRVEVDTLRKEVDVLASELEAAPEVEPAPALAARVKALALHAGVTAAPDALALAERLRNVESAPKIWSTVAKAEYVLSSGSPPDSVAQSVSELEALRQADGTLLRAHVLGARLALRQKKPEAARSLLDEVIALNPNHELARKLLEQLDATGFQP